jgi:putative transposase
VPTPYSKATLEIDLGSEKFLATSDGEIIERHRFFNKLDCKLKLLQCSLKNKKKGKKIEFVLSKRLLGYTRKYITPRKTFSSR